MIKIVGNTPLIKLTNIPEIQEFKCVIYAKCEFLNPTGSATDRVVKNELLNAPRNALAKGNDIIIAGAGDSCLSTAWISSMGELQSTVIMDKDTPSEKKDLIEAIGTRLVPFCKGDDPDENKDYLIKKVQESLTINYQISSGITSSSLLCHYNSTGVEIKNQVGRKIDMLVCGAEAGGMIFGINTRLREEPHTEFLTTIGVDFLDNTFCDGNENELEVPEWTGSVFGPNSADVIFQSKSVTKWYKVSDADSYFMARRLAREEGLMVGPKAGAVLHAALQAIEEFGLKDQEDAVIVIVLNDSLWKCNRDFISNSWMIQNNHLKAERMESLFWWWDMPINNIKLSTMVLFPESTTVGKALEVFEKAEASRGVVVDSLDKTLGVVAFRSLKSLVDKNLITKTDTLTKGTYCTEYKTLDSRANIAEIHPLLQETPYVLIVQKMLTLLGDTDVPKESDEIIGVVDQQILTKFLLQIEKHHQDNFGIMLSDGNPSCYWFERNAFKDENENKL